MGVKTQDAKERLEMKDCPACEESRAIGGNFCRKCGKQLKDPIELKEKQA